LLLHRVTFAYNVNGVSDDQLQSAEEKLVRVLERVIK
jgi:hypothetical protein